MLVQIADAVANVHTVSWQGQDQINDLSGSLPPGAVGPGAIPQQVAPANTARGGLLFQNTSVNPMLLNEVNDVATSSWIVNPGEYWPSISNFPIPAGIIFLTGTENSTVADTFALREWVNAAGE